MPQHVQYFPSLFNPIITSQNQSLNLNQNQNLHSFSTTTNPSFSNLLEPSTCYDLNWDFNHKEESAAPLLFSAHHEAASATMSATALLQKAAEIGATTSEPGNKQLCGLYSTSTLTCSGFGSDVESSVNDNSALNQMQMQMYSSSSKRRRMHNNDDDGETRDFLGVGICHPSSINGWI